MTSLASSATLLHRKHPILPTPWMTRDRVIDRWFSSPSASPHCHPKTNQIPFSKVISQPLSTYIWDMDGNIKEYWIFIWGCQLIFCCHKIFLKFVFVWTVLDHDIVIYLIYIQFYYWHYKINTAMKVANFLSVTT